ncbi:MAG TPA: cytochrome c [Alphaproteobacteria bacterium]|nr:cytochrome c [Alphaproteobacteria bacterium]
MRPWHRRIGVVAAALLVLAVAACDRMATQPKRKAYESGPEGGTADRIPPDGTVPRDSTGPVPPLSLAVLERGRQRFDVYCSPCHSVVGDGDGMIVRRGFPHPPNYTDDRLVKAPLRHFYDVITNGYGAMYPYAARVAPNDRWAVAAYIRALQLSQHDTVADLSGDEKAKLK